MIEVAGIHGFRRADGRVGARNHFFILPSVVCSALVARQIADAVGATSVSHQDGCGHIGADIVQTRSLFVGLATNPNVHQSMVVSLGCETVQGAQVAKEIEARNHTTRFVSIQNSGGNDLARDAGIDIASEMRSQAPDANRVAVQASDVTMGIAATSGDPRAEPLIRIALEHGARVVLAGTFDLVEERGPSVAVGQFATEPMSIVRDAGAGAQMLAALASCGAQVLVEFPSNNQPPQGFPLAPVVSVSSGEGLHTAIEGDFDVSGGAEPAAIWTRALEIFSGELTKAETRGSASFAIPRLLRTM